jgi:tetratricopeptide (TPR) repeat protein
VSLINRPLHYSSLAKTYGSVKPLDILRRMPVRNKVWLVILSLGLQLIPLKVAAQSEDLAQSHYMAGQAYYKQARYQESIREFEEAFRLSDKAALLFNIAQAYERSGNLDQTVEYLKRYLKHPDTKDQTGVEERLKNLQERLSKTGIQVQCDVIGAAVTVDGKTIGQTPLGQPVSVAAGSHEIKVEKVGYKVFTAFVSVVAGSIIPVAAKLVSEGNSVTAAPANQPVVSEAAETPRKKRFWTWIVGGSGAALIITGAITGGLALGKASDANMATASSEKTDNENSAKRLALVSDVTIGLGAACVAGAAILYFYEGKPEQAKTVIAPMIGPRQVGLGATFTF